MDTAGSDLVKLKEELMPLDSKVRPIRKAAKAVRTKSVDGDDIRSKKREKRKVRRARSLDFESNLPSALPPAQSDKPCVDVLPSEADHTHGPNLKSSSGKDLEELQEELKQPKPKKLGPIRGAAKLRRAKSIDGEGGTRRKRKVRRARSLDYEVVSEHQPEPEPELEQALDPDLNSSVPLLSPGMQSDTAQTVESSSEITGASSPGSVSSKDGQDKDESLHVIDETRLQAELEREDRKSANEERLTMWEYARDKEARKCSERAEKATRLPESERERLEFLSGTWEGRGAGTKAWWWKPIPNAGGDHISLGIRNKATLADRLRLTYEEKLREDKIGTQSGYGLSAAARKAAELEAKELERHDTVQYLNELKKASVERAEGHKLDVKARRLDKLRKLAAQGGRSPGLVLSSTSSS